jgi:hypothetical protein
VSFCISAVARQQTLRYIFPAHWTMNMAIHAAQTTPALALGVLVLLAASSSHAEILSGTGLRSRPTASLLQITT